MSRLAVALVILAPAAQAREGTPSSGESTEITIGLPADRAPEVTVAVDEGGVIVDLPAGATVPPDVAGVSGGLLRSAVLTKLSADRVRLDLKLAGGLFYGATYGPRSVTLRFHRRLAHAGAEAGATGGHYVLGADDKLRISVTVNGTETLNHETVIGRNGAVSAPLIGEIVAAGESVDSFTSNLTELLARDYLVSPKVDVEVIEYRSQWVMVTGEVKKAGRIYLHGATRLTDVLAEAEGYTADAGESVTISRQNGKPGESQNQTLDRGAFERGEVNPEIRHGDIVTVEPAAVCFVNGEVRTPGPVKVTRGMTLLRAISVAGGFTEWANRKEIQVSLKNDDSPPKIYNVNKLEDKPELDPPVKGGELIVVKRRFL